MNLILEILGKVSFSRIKSDPESYCIVFLTVRKALELDLKFCSMPLER